MKRKIKWERVLLFFVLGMLTTSIIIDIKQQKQIKDMKNLIEKAALPIELKDGYYYDTSNIPTELLEKEVIINE